MALTWESVIFPNSLKTELFKTEPITAISDDYQALISVKPTAGLVGGAVVGRKLINKHFHVPNFKSNNVAASHMHALLLNAQVVK